METNANKPARIYKVYLLNANVIGQMCGYGEGFTHEAAIADALMQARRRDERAYYDANTRQVVFSARVVL